MNLLISIYYEYSCPIWWFYFNKIAGRMVGCKGVLDIQSSGKQGYVVEEGMHQGSLGGYSFARIVNQHFLDIKYYFLWVYCSVSAWGTLKRSIPAASSFGIICDRGDCCHWGNRTLYSGRTSTPGQFFSFGVPRILEMSEPITEIFCRAGLFQSLQKRADAAWPFRQKYSLCSIYPLQ